MSIGEAMTTSVVSPALTFFPSNSNFALRRKVSQRPRPVVNSPPLSFWILISVITSTFLDVSACTVLEKSVNDTINSEQTIDKKTTNFFIFSPFSDLFFINQRI